MNKIKEDSIFEGTIDFANSGNASINILDKNIFIFGIKPSIPSSEFGYFLSKLVSNN